MIIRKASITDINKLVSIGKKVKEFNISPNIKGFWDKAILQTLIKSKSDLILVAEENKNIIGFVIFTYNISTKKATFENAWVHPNYRGKSIISNLTKQGIKKLKSQGAKYICALVEVNNNHSIKFLKKHKFEKGFNFTWMHKKI